MSDMINFGDFKGLADYAGKGAAALLPFDGLVKLDLLQIEKEVSQAGNKILDLAYTVNDEFNGAKVTGTLYTRIPYTGTRKDGKPNSIGLRDWLRSFGWTAERIDSMADAGKSLSIDDLIADVKRTKTCYARVGTREYQGKTTSDIKGYVTPEQFARDTGNGTAKTARFATGASNGTTTGSTASSNFLDNLTQ